MPKIDFSQVEDVKNFEPVPDDRYLCKIFEVTEGSTQNGDDMWKLTLEVVGGTYAGRRVFDNLAFTAKAMSRVKLVCSRLGVDVSGEVDLEPSMLQGKYAWVEVRQEEYPDNEGKVKTRNVVTFAGYEEASDSDVQMALAEQNDSDANIPF